MKIVYQRLIVVTSLVLFVVACGSELVEPNPVCDATARTCYEALNLDTPESAVMTFTDGFRRGDFQSVWLILSVRAQRAWGMYASLLQFERLYWKDRKGEALEGLFSEGPPWKEQTDYWYLFDLIMLAAKTDSAFLIDLSGEMVVERTEDSETNYGETAVDVIARVENIEGEVVFRMVQALSGRWRVYQVIVPEGDEELTPWAVVNETIEIVRIEAAAEIESPCSENPPSAPEEVSGQPYLLAEPTCGILTERDEEHQVAPGTTLMLTGQGFVPDAETKIWWADPFGNEFLARQEGEYVIFEADGQGSFQVDIVMPYAIASMGEGSHTWTIRATQEIPASEP